MNGPSSTVVSKASGSGNSKATKSTSAKPRSDPNRSKISQALKLRKGIGLRCNKDIVLTPPNGKSL